MPLISPSLVRVVPVCLVALTLAGCVTEQGPTPAKAPASAAPTALVPIASDFRDTDLNRYRDSTTVMVYVYADPSRYPIPMAAEGAFEFQLEGATGQRLARWSFDERQTRAAMRQLAPGPGFEFTLSLLELGSDRLGEPEAQLLVTFTPAGGRPIVARPSAPLLIGPLSPAASR